MLPASVLLAPHGSSACTLLPTPPSMTPQPPAGHSQLLQSPQPEEGAVLQHRDLVVTQQPVGRAEEQGKPRYSTCQAAPVRAPVTHGAGGRVGTARPAMRSGSPGCAAGTVAMVKSQGQACTAEWGHRMQRLCREPVPWSTRMVAPGWRCPGLCQLLGYRSCTWAWVQGAAHVGDEIPTPAPIPRRHPEDLQPGGDPMAPPGLALHQPDPLWSWHHGHPGSLPALRFHPKIKTFAGQRSPCGVTGEGGRAQAPDNSARSSLKLISGN